MTGNGVSVAQPDITEPGLFAQAGRSGDHVVLGTNASTAIVTVEHAREYVKGVNAIIAAINQSPEAGR